MEHEDNAHFDNFLQNRLTESLQNAGSAGNAADVAAELVPNIGPKTGEHDGEHDDEEEWKYIKEVQQSEKQQQQQQQFAFGVGNANGNGNGIGIAAVGNGNGSGGGSNSDAYMSLGMDLSLGNGVGVGVGVGSAAGFRAYDAAEEEEEDVEVIKNDGDFSTNSNTTTTSTTGEVEEPQVQQSLLPNEAQVPKDQQLLHDEEEDEPSSVATTYGTSSLSEQQHEQEPEHNPAEAQLEFFDNKENADPVGFDRADIETELESHSQLNPNAVEFVPHFGSQPSSPAPTSPTSHMAIVEPLQSLGRQLLTDDLVAESPRKGTRDCNMDTIAVPDESEFDNEAAKRPHELEQEDDNFPDNVTEMSHDQLQLQLQNGGGIFQQEEQRHRIDHGPETSVDLDADLEPEVISEQGLTTAQDDIMKQSIYGETISNASIEDILNSVQQLPQQTPGEEPLKEKELLNVEEKELVSQSPSIEELHQHQLHQQQLVDPMQASFYLEHTSSDALAQEANDQEPSLLLDTSAPFSPLEDSPHLDIQPTATTLEFQPQQADIVDITPSPISSSTEEKHLVEETKEQQQNLIEEPLELSNQIENAFNAGVPSQVS